MSATTVAEFNELTGANVDELAIVGILRDLFRKGYLSGEPEAMTAADAEFVEAHGKVSSSPSSLLASRVRSEALATVMDSENLTVGQVADRLDLSTSRVRHKIREGTLYAYPSDGRGVERKVPSWQFRGARPAPHLSDVLGALPENFSLTEIRGFALHSGVDDANGDSVVPLLDWLFDGRDPAPARELAHSLRYTL